MRGQVLVSLRLAIHQREVNSKREGRTDIDAVVRQEGDEVGEGVGQRTRIVACAEPLEEALVEVAYEVDVAEEHLLMRHRQHAPLLHGRSVAVE